VKREDETEETVAHKRAFFLFDESPSDSESILLPAKIAPRITVGALHATAEYAVYAESTFKITFNTTRTVQSSLTPHDYTVYVTIDYTSNASADYAFEVAISDGCWKKNDTYSVTLTPATCDAIDGVKEFSNLIVHYRQHRSRRFSNCCFCKDSQDEVSEDTASATIDFLVQERHELLELLRMRQDFIRVIRESYSEQYPP